MLRDTKLCIFRGFGVYSEREREGFGAMSGDLYPRLGSCLLCWKKLGVSSSPHYIKQDECDVSLVNDYIVSPAIIYSALHSCS